MSNALDKLKALWRVLKSSVSPAFIMLMCASFIMWYILKLQYTYTTDYAVLVNIEGERMRIPCAYPALSRVRVLTCWAIVCICTGRLRLRWLTLNIASPASRMSRRARWWIASLLIHTLYRALSRCDLATLRSSLWAMCRSWVWRICRVRRENKSWKWIIRLYIK